MKKIKMLPSAILLTVSLTLSSTSVFAATDTHSEYFYVSEPIKISGYSWHWHYMEWMDGSVPKSDIFRCTITYKQQVINKYCTKCGKLLGSDTYTSEDHDF